jgi:hypothetical protein
LEETDRYGTKELVQGKKEALKERLNSIREEEEPERDNARLAKLLKENYKQAIGPHTKDDDGRVGVFNEMLKEYTLAVIKSCLEVFAEAQVQAFDEELKGRQEE